MHSFRLKSLATIVVALTVAAVTATSARAATLIWPENRTAYYSDEPIEIAVAGLAQGY